MNDISLLYKRLPVTVSLLCVNVAVFLLTLILPNLSQHLVLVPALVHLQPQRLITSAFIHVNILHLVMNMVSLYSFGEQIEPALGKFRFLSLYLLSALGGSVGVLLFLFPNDRLGIFTATLGASGAIFGIFAAYFAMVKQLNGDTSMLTGILIANLIFSFTVPNISWQAHIGGAIIGLIIGIAFARVLLRRPVNLVMQKRASVLIVVVILGVELVLLIWRSSLLGF